MANYVFHITIYYSFSEILLLQLSQLSDGVLAKYTLINYMIFFHTLNRVIMYTDMLKILTLQ